MNYLSKNLNSRSGMVLLSTTMGVFILLSIFAFYLARFSITENRSSSNYVLDIKARSLALSALNHSFELFKQKRRFSDVNGKINNGEYNVEIIPSKDESDGNLSRSNYMTFQSTSKISNVERKVRFIVSSLPEAFCFAFYGHNTLDNPLNTAYLGTIVGDVFFRGNINSGNGSDDGTNYSSTGNGGQTVSNQPNFPIFDDTYYSNLLAEAANSNNGNIALKLDNQHIYIPNHSDINLGVHSARTIELWFMVEDKFFDAKQTLYEEGGSTRGLNIYINSDGKLYGGGWNKNESKWDGDWINTSSNAITNNQWHHVALTLNGGTTVQQNVLKMYLDGTLVSSKQGSQLWQHGADINVGRNGSTRFKDGYDGTSGENFIGSIDEFKIWNVERSSQEINNTKNNFTEGLELGLTTYYNFENKNTDDMQDVDSKNNGTLFGSIDSNSWVPGPPIDRKFMSTVIDLRTYQDSTFYVNGNLLISNSTIIGPGKIVVNGNLTINSGSKTENSNVEENYFYFLCKNEFSILDSEEIGSALNNYVIAYSKGNIIMKNINTFYGLIISKGNELNIENSNVFGAVYNESPTFNLNSNVVLNGSVVSKYSINILNESVSITKNNLPLFKNQSIGFDPFILPESYLEY
mgnify:CR=1 FL=1